MVRHSLHRQDRIPTLSGDLTYQFVEVRLYLTIERRASSPNSEDDVVVRLIRHSTYTTDVRSNEFGF